MLIIRKSVCKYQYSLLTSRDSFGIGGLFSGSFDQRMFDFLQKFFYDVYDVELENDC